MFGAKWFGIGLPIISVTPNHAPRSSEYGSLSRQLYATDVSTGKTVALACTPPGTGAILGRLDLQGAGVKKCKWSAPDSVLVGTIMTHPWKLCSYTLDYIMRLCDILGYSTAWWCLSVRDARWGEGAHFGREAAQRARTTDEYRHRIMRMYTASCNTGPSTTSTTMTTTTPITATTTMTVASTTVTLGECRVARKWCLLYTMYSISLVV